MIQPIRVLIVEDEFVTADTIKDGLEEIGYKISGMAKDAEEALSILEEKETDIAILDINIQGDEDGIWLANKIKEQYSLPFLFLTAYSDKETIESAIRTKPYSFLIKPFNKIDIYAAIELALKNATTVHEPTPDKEKSKDQTPHLIDDYLFVKKKHLYSKIRLKDILFIQSELKYIQIHLKDETYMLRYNISEFLIPLPKDQFIQVHRSYIVNKEKIDQIGSNLVIINNVKIPLSPSRKDSLLKLIHLM